MLCISTQDRRDKVDVDEIKDVEPCFRMFERMDYTTKQILVVNVRRFTLDTLQIFYLSFIWVILTLIAFVFAIKILIFYEKIHCIVCVDYFYLNLWFPEW